MALSSKVGIGTAVHMWVTAPGFYFIERGLMGLRPNSTWWAQLIPLAAGIAAVPATYWLARTFSLGRRVALMLALFVCVSPVTVMYSTRVKEYGADFLLSCLLLWCTEVARRRRTDSQYRLLAVISVLAFVVSASVGPEIAATWTALALLSGTWEHLRRHVLPVAIVVAVGCCAIAGTFYRHLSPYIGKPWIGWYVVHTSPTAFIGSVVVTLWRLFGDLFDVPRWSPTLDLLVFIGFCGLLVAGLSRGRAMLAPACLVVAALGSSAMGVTPLGTGRTDEYLYPALLVLVGSGIARVASPVLSSMSRATRYATFAVAVLVGAVMVAHALVSAPPYPGVNVGQLAAEVQHAEQPGDHVVVGELMRYPWALYEDRTPHIEFGPDWSTGFTVVSTDPSTFIVPSEPYEGGSRPTQWAAQLSTNRRLWFVGTSPHPSSPTYKALRRLGWRPVRTLRAPGCAAILLQRSDLRGT
ncbi:MAG TPA: glycosyltransferase family 39 protein [Acidimicrobiales bacterium]